LIDHELILRLRATGDDAYHAAALLESLDEQLERAKRVNRKLLKEVESLKKKEVEA
jgi:hypothetical protein